MPSVICPNCAGRFHETTPSYNPDEITTGNMLRLKAQYVSNGWTSFPETEEMKYGALECPECGSQYSSDGKVRVEQVEPGKVPCPHCGEMFKAGALHFHVKAKHDR